MAKIFKRSDRIAVKINDITVKLAPLSLEQKTTVQEAMIEAQKSASIRKAQHGIALAIKYSLKDISGVTDAEDKPYKLAFEESGELTDECVDELFNLDIKEKLTMVCISMVKGVPTQFTDDQNKALEGVELVTTSKVDDSKNA